MGKIKAVYQMVVMAFPLIKAYDLSENSCPDSFPVLSI
jgi:hypothetical protein